MSPTRAHIVHIAYYFVHQSVGLAPIAHRITQPNAPNWIVGRLYGEYSG